ncbi:MAG: hypothetical protein ACYTFA_17135, partial [Planctomycetota bacterium]
NVFDMFVPMVLAHDPVSSVPVVAAVGAVAMASPDHDYSPAVVVVIMATALAHVRVMHVLDPCGPVVVNVYCQGAAVASGA